MFDSSDTFVIADCHLDGSRPELTRLFIQFIYDIQGAAAVWIVGDFVEFWLGDDAGNPALKPVFDALSAIQSNGTDVHLLHGNRDFLIGHEFAASIGATLHTDDEVHIELGGEPVLVMHGDTLCTDDLDYQRFRAMVRSAPVQAAFLAKSVPERIEEVKARRRDSRDESAAKTDDIMNVNQDTVVERFANASVRTLIHGHTHRPATHEHTVNGQRCQRMVVGDWHEDHAMVLHHNSDGFQLRRYPFG